MDCITFFFGLFYWVTAIVMSLFYGRKSFEIHEDHRSRTTSIPFKYHQYWFNTLGSFIGWVLLWIILPRLWDAIIWHDTDLAIKEIVLLFIAFIGITGHYPLIGYGFSKSISTLVERFTKN